MSPFEELKEKEREARRQLILSSAQKLFSERDFRKVTVREIAKTAGVSSGTIYRYYKNMDELFLDIFLIHATEISNLINREYENQGKCSVEKYCEIHVNYLNDHMTFYQMMSHFMLSGLLPSETSEKMDPIMRSLMENLEKILNDAGVKKDSRIKAHALFASLNGTMISYARYPGRTFEEVKAHTLKLADVIAKNFIKS